MFYSHQLLARKAPLGQIWMAATLHAKINRKKLDKLDIIQICEEILNPPVPMVFRLSGISMGGVLIVYERKVKLLFDDGTRLLVDINGVWRTKAVPDPTLLLKGKTHARKKAVTLPKNSRTEGAWRKHGGTDGNTQANSYTLSGTSGAANPGSGSSDSDKDILLNEDDGFTLTGKIGKRTRLLQDATLDHGTIVFVDFETVGFEPSLNVEVHLISNILAAVKRHDPEKYQDYHLAGVKGFATNEDIASMEKIFEILKGQGVVLHSFHKRQMLCRDCQTSVAQAGVRVKDGDLLQISLIENICKHAMFLKNHDMENSSIAILSGDRFFNETVVSTLRYCGIDAFCILPHGTYRKEMTKRVGRGSVYSETSSSSGGDQPRSLSGLEIRKSSSKVKSKSKELHIVWDFENSWVNQGVEVHTLKQRIQGSLKGNFEVKSIFAVGPENRESRLLGRCGDFTLIKTPKLGKRCGMCQREIVDGYDEELLMRTTDIADCYGILLMYELSLLGEDCVLVVTRDGDFAPSVRHLKYMVAKPKLKSCDTLIGKLTWQWETLQK